MNVLAEGSPAYAISSDEIIFQSLLRTTLVLICLFNKAMEKFKAPDSIVYSNVTIKQEKVSDPKSVINIVVEVDPYMLSAQVETEDQQSSKPVEYTTYNERPNDPVKFEIETLDKQKGMGKSRAEYMKNYRKKKREEKMKTGKLEPKKIAKSSTQRSRDFRAHALISTTEEKHEKPAQNYRKSKRKCIPKKVQVVYELSSEKEFSPEDRNIDLEKPHRCQTCGKRFRKKPKLTVHLRIHTGERPFKCPTCSKQFRTKGTLNVHEYLHLGLKPFSCEVCNKKYTTKQQLTIHTRVHTGEKPFSCKICGKTFKDKWKLTLHEHTHSGLKPFECDKCDKKYTTKYQLTTHYRIHTGEKLFSCEICTKQFTERCKMKLHQKTHLGVKPYSCNLCDKRYLNKSHLKIHIESIHLPENVK
ncbi:hypothetical protein evm_012220 [Chilo suppressalis]|nr:hypothetical protein evm_012220 [Chilo suppressalis]